MIYDIWYVHVRGVIFISKYRYFNTQSHCIGPCTRIWDSLPVNVQTTPMRYTYSVRMPGTRVTGRDCGLPEDELSELVRSGYSTISTCFPFVQFALSFLRFFSRGQ
jgi:hypothetical protein